MQTRIIQNQVESDAQWRAPDLAFQKVQEGERKHWAIRFYLPGVRAGAMIGDPKMGDYPTEQIVNERWKRLH